MSAIAAVVDVTTIEINFQPLDLPPSIDELLCRAVEIDPSTQVGRGFSALMGMVARRAGSMQNYVAKSRPLGTCLRAAVLITSRPSHLLANLPGMHFVIWSWGRAALSVRAARERGADRGRVVVRTTRARRRIA
jgi:hypothetical protein